jgi:hypothetical protein
MDRIETQVIAAPTSSPRLAPSASISRNARTAGRLKPREPRRITVAQRIMLYDVTNDPSHAPAALARVTDRAASMRREGSPLCSEPWFRRLEANLRRLAGRPAEIEAWYLSAWQRLFAVMRRTERERARSQR